MESRFLYWLLCQIVRTIVYVVVTKEDMLSDGKIHACFCTGVSLHIVMSQCTSLTCVRDHSYTCMCTHTGVGHTVNESAQHFWLGKTLTNVSCASAGAGVWTSGLWITSLTLYQLSHPVTLCCLHCLSQVSQKTGRWWRPIFSGAAGVSVLECHCCTASFPACVRCHRKQADDGGQGGISVSVIDALLPASIMHVPGVPEDRQMMEAKALS